MLMHLKTFKYKCVMIVICDDYYIYNRRQGLNIKEEERQNFLLDTI